MAGPKLEILLCAPRGFCAGVERAIQIVEESLARYGAPVYVRHEIVHNRYVVESLKAKGAVFVEELAEIPESNRPVVFSAHGVAKSVREDAAGRNIVILDATCPLVSKVHKEAILHFRRGHDIVLVGHAGHPEVEGTMGQLPQGRHQPGRDGRGCPHLRAARPEQPRLDHADDALDRRHVGDRGGAEGAFPDHRRAAQGRHLLRHDQPSGGGEARRSCRRSHDRRRCAEFVEFAAACGSRGARRLPEGGSDPAGLRDRLERLRGRRRRSA